MANPVAQLRGIDDPAVGHYDALVFWCPGCEVVIDGERHAGAHMLPVNSSVKNPSWSFDGNLEAPTLSPSILSRFRRPQTPEQTAQGSEQWPEVVCHSFLRSGQLEFLSDCTHQYAGQTVPLPPLPDWLVKEGT